MSELSYPYQDKIWEYLKEQIKIPTSMAIGYPRRLGKSWRDKIIKSNKDILINHGHGKITFMAFDEWDDIKQDAFERLAITEDEFKQQYQCTFDEDPSDKKVMR